MKVVVLYATRNRKLAQIFIFIFIKDKDHFIKIKAQSLKTYKPTTLAKLAQGSGSISEDGCRES